MFDLTPHGQSQFDANVAWAILAITAVAIRIWCKIKNKNGVKSDDYWILAALACYLTAVTFAIWG